MNAIIVYEMCYLYGAAGIAELVCVPLNCERLKEYKKIYNDCFFEMRKALKIEPVRVFSEGDGLKEKQSDIYILLDNGSMIGSVVCRGNEIDDLIVKKSKQGQGYGKQLLLWAIQHIRQKNQHPITLKVAEWNERAIMLYKKMGFVIIKRETILKKDKSDD